MGVVTSVAKKIPVIGAGVTFGVLAKNVINAGVHMAKGETAQAKNELAQAAVRGAGAVLKGTGVGTAAGIAADFAADQIASRKNGGEQPGVAGGQASPENGKTDKIAGIYNRLVGKRNGVQAPAEQVAENEKAVVPKA